jgi:hypothetical protein
VGGELLAFDRKWRKEELSGRAFDGSHSGWTQGVILQKKGVVFQKVLVEDDLHRHKPQISQKRLGGHPLPAIRSIKIEPLASAFPVPKLDPGGPFSKRIPALSSRSGCLRSPGSRVGSRVTEGAFFQQQESESLPSSKRVRFLKKED